jgi:hypothetical protein
MIIKLKCLAEKFPFVSVASKKIVDLRNYFRFKRDFNYYKSLSDSHLSLIRWKDRYPCLNDRTSTTSFDRHYVFHTAWAARVLARTFPKEHMDISSSLYFVSLVAAFVPIQFYDYRPADFNLSRLQSDAADLLALPFPDASVSSISCMHVIEH